MRRVVRGPASHSEIAWLERPLTRRQMLQGGALLGSGLLVAACGSSTPTPRPQASALARATAAAASVPPSAPPAAVLSADLLRTALGDLPTGGTVSLPGGHDVQLTDLETAAIALAAASNAYASVGVDPVATLGFILACADWSGRNGVVDLSVTLPKLDIPVVRLELPKLPGSELTDTLTQATPPGFVLRPGAALFPTALLPDGRLVLGIADPARTVAGHPRLELALLAPATAGPLIEAAGATLDPSGAIALPGEAPVRLAAVDPSLVSSLVAAAGVLFVDRAPLQPSGAKQPVLTVDPAVPTPDPALVPVGSRISRSKDGRILALDAAGKPIARAADLGGNLQWVGPDTAAGLDYFLRELADGLRMRLGVAPDGAQISASNTAYLTRIGEYFNEDLLSVAQSDINPAEGSFSFGWLDQLLAVADDHRMSSFSYLFWSGGAPGWLKQGAFSRQKLLALAEEYVATVVQRYKGQIGAWIVVNEPVWQQSEFWQTAFGSQFPAFIQDAFRWARAADPAATLMLADYAIEGRDLPTTQQFYRLLQQLLAAKAPIDAVGIEGHLVWRYDNPTTNPQFSPQVFADWIGRYRKLGVEVWITEFDVDMTGFAGTKQAESALQAQWYHDYLQAALDAGAQNLTIYGLTDATSWYNLTGEPHADALMLNGDYTPKPAYFAVRDVLKAELRKRGWTG